MKSHLLFFCLLLPFVSLSQRQVKRFYTEKWKALPDSVGASYFRVIQLDASGVPSPFTKDYFIKGELRYEGKIKDPFDPTSPNDSINSWYRKDGTLEMVSQSRKGRLDGRTVYFYENGHSIKEERIFKEGEEVSRQFFDPQGKKQIYIPASFPGGKEEMEQYLKNKTARLSVMWGNYEYVHGRVLIECIVSEGGYLRDIKVLHTTQSLLNATAVTIVSEMPKWEPATLDGKPFESTVPIQIQF